MSKNYVYTLEHRGEKFRMHGITSVVVNSAFSCNVCKRRFALDVIAALLNRFINTHCECRDLTCCRAVGHVGTTGIMYLRTMATEQPARVPLELPESTRVPQPDEPNAKHLPGEPGFEHEVECELPVCRWCKGTREITINFKTKPCDCAKQENVSEGQKMESIGRDWSFGYRDRGSCNRSPPMSN